MSAKDDLVNYIVKNSYGELNPNVIDQLASNISAGGSEVVKVNFTMDDEYNITADKTPLQVFELMKNQLVIGVLTFGETQYPLGVPCGTSPSGEMVFSSYNSSEGVQTLEATIKANLINNIWEVGGD